jgi:hypothetical protein
VKSHEKKNRNKTMVKNGEMKDNKKVKSKKEKIIKY